MHPELLARHFLETHNTFDLRIKLMIGDEDASLCDHWPRVTGAYSRTPADLKSRDRNGVEDATLTPDAIAVRPVPLRPIVGAHVDGLQQGQGNCHRPKRS